MSVLEVLAIRLTGKVDYQVLDVLCAELEMEPEGRLDDDYDESFGTRWLRPVSDGFAWLSLYRDTKRKWQVAVAAEPHLLTADEVSELARQVFVVAAKVNLRAKETYRRQLE